MKKILLGLGLITLISCSERGEVYDQPTDFIIIHGKTYKLMRVIPSDGANGIWIMYPKDSNDAMPTILNYQVQQGKATVNQAVIKVN
jgi:hypothetical protein